MENITIRLSNLEFHSRIGVLEQERNVGNDFRVNVEITYPASGFVSEDLDSSINYADIYDIISCIMRKDHLLLETVSSKIGNEIKSLFSNLLRIKVEVIKISPPINGIIGEASVEYFYEKK